MILPAQREISEMNFENIGKEKLRAFAMTVLGEEYYHLIENFFERVWNSDATYKVFFARRCLNLMYTFYKCRKGKLDSRIEYELYSDSALLANVPEIADCYMQFGVIPKILLADDILIYGRTINWLIHSLIDSILSYCSKNGHNYIYSEIEQAVQNSISIVAIVQNRRPMLVEGSFINCIKCDNRLEPARWHEISSRITQLISEGFIANTSYIISLYECKKGDDNIHKQLAQAAKMAGFRESRWNKHLRRDAWVRPIKNSSGDIMAFYTIRFAQNAIDKSYKITPFVLAADMVCKKGCFPFEDPLLFDDYKSSYTDISGIVKTRAEAMSMLLSHNILLLLQEDLIRYGIISQKFVEQSRLDIGKISFNFRGRRFSEQYDFFDKLISLNSPFATWEEMDSFILDSTSSSEPLFVQQANKQNFKENYLIENILADQGIKIETQAILQYTGLIPTVVGAEKAPLYKLCREIQEKSFVDDATITDIIGELLRNMDMGTVAISTKCTGEAHDRYACVYRACEHSQFIYPQRYMNYIPTLAQMELDCRGNIKRIKERIQKFFSINPFGSPELADDLSRFTEQLYNSGQYIYEWDIDLINMTTMEESMPDEADDEKTDNMLLAQMANNLSAQMTLKKLYRQLYPET